MGHGGGRTTPTFIEGKPKAGNLHPDSWGGSTTPTLIEEKPKVGNLHPDSWGGTDRSDVRAGVVVPPHASGIRIFLLWRLGVVVPPNQSGIRIFLLWRPGVVVPSPLLG